MNKKLLRAAMAENGDTGTMLAEALGITPSTLSVKMNNRNGADFTQSEMFAIMKRYSLTAERMQIIFFTQKVS